MRGRCIVAAEDALSTKPSLNRRQLIEPGTQFLSPRTIHSAARLSEKDRQRLHRILDTEELPSLPAARQSQRICLMDLGDSVLDELLAESSCLRLHRRMIDIYGSNVSSTD